MIKRIIVLLLFMSLSACNIDSIFFPKKPAASGEKIWSFIEYHVPEKDGSIEDYYYFGLVSKDLYEKIKSNEVKDGMIFMEKVRYWNNDDVIEGYDDELYSDELAFRIEHIVKFERVKKEPVVGFKYDDDEDETLIETENMIE